MYIGNRIAERTGSIFFQYKEGMTKTILITYQPRIRSMDIITIKIHNLTALEGKKQQENIYIESTEICW